MVGHIYPTEFQLIKANSFLGLDLSITNCIIHLKPIKNGMILILEMLLASLPMMYIFRSLFFLRKYVLEIVTSTTENIFEYQAIKTRL